MGLVGWSSGSALHAGDPRGGGHRSPDPPEQSREGRVTKRALPRDTREEIPKFAIHVHSSDKRPPAEEV
jgi:hypothetical protein